MNTQTGVSGIGVTKWFDLTPPTARQDTDGLSLPCDQGWPYSAREISSATATGGIGVTVLYEDSST